MVTNPPNCPQAGEAFEVSSSAVGQLWLGPVADEARAAFARAREAGLSSLRALVIGSVASFKECWAFRRKLAAHVGCSVRTVARALRQAKEEGLIGVARAKKGEKPPNFEGDISCGWSHRWVIGWGAAGKAVQQRVAAAKARWLIRQAMQPAAAPKASPAPAEERKRGSHPPTDAQRRKWTAAELDAELARIERNRRPPD